MPFNSAGTCPSSRFRIQRNEQLGSALSVPCACRLYAWPLSLNKEVKGLGLVQSAAHQHKRHTAAFDSAAAGAGASASIMMLSRCVAAAMLGSIAGVPAAAAGLTAGSANGAKCAARGTSGTEAAAVQDGLPSAAEEAAGAADAAALAAWRLGGAEGEASAGAWSCAGRPDGPCPATGVPPTGGAALLESWAAGAGALCLGSLAGLGLENRAGPGGGGGGGGARRLSRLSVSKRPSSAE